MSCPGHETVLFGRPAGRELALPIAGWRTFARRNESVLFPPAGRASGGGPKSAAADSARRRVAANPGSPGTVRISAGRRIGWADDAARGKLPGGRPDRRA